MTRWQGKTAIICGASSGLGLALTRELARQGATKLILLARDPAKLTAAADALQNEFSGLSLSLHPIDVTQAAQAQALAESLSETAGQVDLLIQAVGQSDRGTIQSLEAETLQRLIQTNVLSSVHAIQYFSPLLRKPSGRIVLIGSLASKFTPRFLGGYAIAKHALAALAGQTRLELAESGIHVTLACPGPIARSDAGSRYSAHANSSDLPTEALSPGGGARLKGLDPSQLAQDILWATYRRKPEIIRPRKARLLLILSALSPRLGDWLLRRKSA